ncbi:MAG: YfaZ family protein [Rhodobacteraceae bacterium]|nr:YfaZ family protein [Paracoccaceae bacterium]
MTHPRTARGHLAVMACLAAAALPATAEAQSWDYTGSLYLWMSGLDTSVETPLGTVETELSFSDILEDLDFAFFGTFGARNGPWVVLGDLNYSALTSTRDTPFGAVFSDVEVETELTIASAFGGYAVVDRPDLRIEAGAGLRFYDVSVDTRLVGNPGVADREFPLSESWTDLILGVNLRAPVAERWYVRGYADAGGFGIGGSSELSWQVYAGGGYLINDTWSVEAGYRYLSIDKELDRADVTLEQSGPLIGLTARF